MSKVKDEVCDIVRRIKKERKTITTHIITWGYTIESQIGLSGDFVYLYEDQIEQALAILKCYPEVDGIFVSRYELDERYN